MLTQARPKAVVRFYPVRWYTYTVTAEPQAEAATDRRGRCTVPVARIFEPEQEFGVRYCNCLSKWNTTA